MKRLYEWCILPEQCGLVMFLHLNAVPAVTVCMTPWLCPHTGASASVMHTFSWSRGGTGNAVVATMQHVEGLQELDAQLCCKLTVLN